MITESVILNSRVLKNDLSNLIKKGGKLVLVPFSFCHIGLKAGYIHLGNYKKSLLSKSDVLNKKYIRLGDEDTDGIVPVFFLKLSLIQKQYIIASSEDC